MVLDVNTNNMLYLVCNETEANDYSEEIYKLTRPTSLGDSGYGTTGYFSIFPHDTTDEAALGFDKDGVNIPIHADADTTALAAIFDIFVTDGYCTGTDKTNCLNAIDAAKGTTVNISTAVPATMWTNRLTQAGFNAWELP